jgi:hypothetical protein
MISESKFSELLARQQECGLSITAFFSNEGLPKATFYYWRKTATKTKCEGFYTTVSKARTYFNKTTALQIT